MLRSIVIVDTTVGLLNATFSFQRRVLPTRGLAGADLCNCRT